MNIIPVIAKADTLTPEECARFKKTVSGRRGREREGRRGRKGGGEEGIREGGRELGGDGGREKEREGGRVRESLRHLQKPPICCLFGCK